VSESVGGGEAGAQSSPTPALRGRLLSKYVALLVGIVSLPLLASGAFGIWSSYQDHKTSLIRLQREQAQAAAARISQFVKEIEGQVGWISQLAGAAGTAEQRRFAMRLLLRQAPAITDIVSADADGHEQLRISRLDMDVIGSRVDLSREASFVQASAHKVYYGPVHFRGESEPYMTIALAGARRDAGIVIAEVNLKFIWDVVSQIKVGDKGSAYVVDADGRLIAHPDIGLVLRNSDLSPLAQVKAALHGGSSVAPEDGQIAADVEGRRVLTAHADIVPPGWLMFVELPLEEAYAPVYASLLAAALVLLAGLVLAVTSSFMLARKMVTPIRPCRQGPPGSEPACSIIASISRPETSWRPWAGSSTAWPCSCNNPTRRWSERSTSAPISSSSPISQNPASWRRRATICGSRSMRSGCSSLSCGQIQGPWSTATSSAASMRRSRR
jgi:hypothetical protein